MYLVFKNLKISCKIAQQLSENQKESENDTFQS